jgi:hypothetical protein
LPADTVIDIAGPTGQLQGTMTGPPSGKTPLVLIIPGSGPTDRDGNSPLGIRAATYRLLAQGLASKGIRSVRIDKRGMFGSRAAAADANAVTITDYAADVRAWAAALRKRTGAACVTLLGHSEGGLVALAAAADARDFCGLVLVATPGRPLGTILREQLRANPANAPVLDNALSALDRLEKGQRVPAGDVHPALQPLFGPAVQGFLISALAQDPARLVTDYRGPVLVVQGARDLQVSGADAERLKAANPKARLVLLPDVNHVLKTVASDDRAANIATYADPALPLAPALVPAIAEFVLKPR